MIVVEQKDLEDLVKKMIQAVGSEELEAKVVADNLVEANLMGHDSHGYGYPHGRHSVQHRARNWGPYCNTYRTRWSGRVVPSGWRTSFRTHRP